MISLSDCWLLSPLMVFRIIEYVMIKLPLLCVAKPVFIKSSVFGSREQWRFRNGLETGSVRFADK